MKSNGFEGRKDGAAMVRMVTLQRLDELIAAYGSDPMRWPAAERPAAQALLARSPEVVARLEAERRLDESLDGAFAEVSETVAARVGASIARAVASRAQSDAGGLSWGAMLWSATAATWPRAAAFAGIAMLGIVAGLSSDPSASSAADGVFDGLSGTPVMGEIVSWSE
jgi:hypothetical protein